MDKNHKTFLARYMYIVAIALMDCIVILLLGVPFLFAFYLLLFQEGDHKTFLLS